MLPGFSASELVWLIGQTARPATLHLLFALTRYKLWSFSASAMKQFAKLGFSSLQRPRLTLMFYASLSTLFGSPHTLFTSLTSLTRFLYDANQVGQLEIDEVMIPPFPPNS